MRSKQLSSQLALASTLMVAALLTSSCSDSTVPPKATGLQLLTPPPDIAETMIPLTVQPLVQVVDVNGHAVGGSRTITASVVAGAGEVAQGATATTNEKGVAAFSNLTLGAAPGSSASLTLLFSAEGLQSTTSVVLLLCARIPLTIPETINRSLTTGDCTDPNWGHYNQFSLSTTQPTTAVQLSLDGSFAGDLIMQGPNETGAEFWGYGAGAGALDHRVSFKALLPPGKTLITVTPEPKDLLGPYTFTAAPASEDIACDGVAPMAASPIASGQKLGAGDCAQNSFFQDFLVVGLPAQATLSASMTSSAFDPSMVLLEPFTLAVAASSTGQGSTTLTFTNTGESAPYYLMFTSAVALASGPYNFTLNITYPPVSSTPTNAGLTTFDNTLGVSSNQRAVRVGPPLLLRRKSRSSSPFFGKR
jgi:hypothetical protein